MSKNVYTVTQVTQFISNMFSQEPFLGNISVRGELSNVKYHTTGHIYFTLKEGKTQISGNMWRSNVSSLQCKLKDGMAVVVTGKVSIYAAGGTYSINAIQIDAENATGKLYEAYEKLKLQLEEEGLFAAEYKQPIPRYIKKLGVVTASTGAGIRDIITVAKRRNPAIAIYLYPAIVQGEEAPQSIVTGIKALEKAGVDTIIVGRGGGSFEDLNGFNAEMVARAVFDCQIPIISSVGHETDFTIIDFVADQRAATPSVAAELAVDDIASLCDSIAVQRLRLHKAMEKKVSLLKKQGEYLKARLEKNSPEARLHEKRMRLGYLEDQLQELMKAKMIDYKRQMERNEERMQASMKQHLSDAKHRMMVLIERLKGLSPLEKLSRGYGHVETMDGKGINSISKVSVGDELQIFVTDGSILAKAIGTKATEERKVEG